jgi:transposase
MLKRDCKPEEQSFLERLHAHSPLFRTAATIADGFVRLVRNRTEQAEVGLEAWMEEATSSSIPSRVSFACGLRDDWSAVVAGLSLECNNGPVEGAVNRLKRIKRQMFGRANFDLLRRRVMPP